MKIGNIKKPLSPIKETNQNSSFENILTQKEFLEKELSSFQDENKKFSTTEINKILEEIEKLLPENSLYNQVADISLPEIKNNEKDSFFNAKNLEALKHDNRKKLKELQEEAEKINRVLEKELLTSSYSLTYDSDEEEYAFLMTYFFPSHRKGFVSNEEEKFLRLQSSILNKAISKEKIKKATKKAAKTDRQKKTEKQDEILFSQIADLAQRFAYARKDKFDDSIPWYMKNTKYSETWTGKTMRETLLKREINQFLDHLETNNSDLEDSQISMKLGLRPLLVSGQECKKSLSYIEQILTSSDENTSAIDVMFKDKKPLHIGGQSFDFTKYWEGCFDCFLDGFSLGDIKFQFEFELNIKDMLEKIGKTLANIKTAFDLPALISQNFCSLMRLGSLCPVEIAFLIAMMVSLIRFSWQELIVNGKGFLLDLIGSILEPILDLVEGALRFSISPISVHTECVNKSIKKLSDIDKVLPNPQNGWSWNEIVEARNAKVDPNGPERKSLLIQRIEEFTNSNGDNATEDISRTMAAAHSSGSESVVNAIFSSPFLTGNMDQLSTLQLILDEANRKFHNNLNAISLYNYQFGEFLRDHTGKRIEIAARIMALSTLIALLGGIFKAFSSKGIEPCINMPVGQDQNGNPLFTLESPFSPAELISQLESDGLFGVRKDTPFEIIKNNPGIDKEDKIYLQSPLTDKRFNLSNCNKAKTYVEERGSSIDLWKKIALGVDINV